LHPCRPSANVQRKHNERGDPNDGLRKCSVVREDHRHLHITPFLDLMGSICVEALGPGNGCVRQSRCIRLCGAHTYRTHACALFTAHDVLTIQRSRTEFAGPWIWLHPSQPSPERLSAVITTRYTFSSLFTNPSTGCTAYSFRTNGHPGISRERPPQPSHQVVRAENPVRLPTALS
jgi:hypothetical protein